MTSRPYLPFAFFLTALFLSFGALADDQTALDRYIAAPDASYSYRLLNSIPARGYTTHVLEMISQTWLSEKEVDKPVWKHYLAIIRPDTVTSTTGMLFITGGANDRPAPRSASANLVETAVVTKSVVAELRMVPNQPLRFTGEQPRVEDALIAYSWDKYLKTSDERWPARLPMTKAAVRAMDTVTAFCASGDGGAVRIDRFVVSGASKRGWTSWSTAAVDKRVVAIIPIVIDTLNVKKSAIHGYGAYGFWPPAIHDYIEMRMQDWFGRPQYDALMRIEDPWEYRSRYTMPKFVINAAGDQYFVPDSSQFYFDDLPGRKYLRYVPNADHSLRNSDAAQTLLACYQAVLLGTELPKFEWKMEPGGAIRVVAQDLPADVRLWQATNPTARDFRLETLGAVWQSRPLPSDEKGVYLAKVEAPQNGWTAYMVELTYRLPALAHPLKFTTHVRVIPDALPHRFEPPAK